jgi:hypothetical protein
MTPKQATIILEQPTSQSTSIGMMSKRLASFPFFLSFGLSETVTPFRALRFLLRGKGSIANNKIWKLSSLRGKSQDTHNNPDAWLDIHHHRDLNPYARGGPFSYEESQSRWL